MNGARRRKKSPLLSLNFAQVSSDDKANMWMVSYIALFTSLLSFFLFFVLSIEMEGVEDRRNFQRIMHSLYQSVEYVKTRDDIRWLEVQNTLSRGVKINMNLDEDLFGPMYLSSSDQLNPKYYPFLRQLADVMREINLEDAQQRFKSLLTPFLRKGSKISFHLRIEGHTDAYPLAETSRYKSNVELSALRAYSMMRFLRINSGMSDKHFAIAGYGETRPLIKEDPLARENRRVELYIQPQIVNADGSVLSRMQ